MKKQNNNKNINIHIQNLKLTKSQSILYDLATNSAYKYITAAYSRQQGKTTVAKVLLIKWLTEYNNNILYLSPTLKLAKSIYKSIVNLIGQSGLIKNSNSQDLIINSITNSTIMFASSEQSSSLRGQTFTYIILDEAAFLNEGDDNNNLFYNVIWATLKVKGKKLIAISTPNGKQGFFYDLYVKGLNNDNNKEYISIKKTIYDDALIPDSDKNNYINNLKKTIPKIAFKQEFLCEFLDDALTFFHNFDKCFINKDLITNYKSNKYIGIDFSSLGDDQTIVTIIDSEGNVNQKLILGTLDQKYNQIADIINNTSNLKAAYGETNSIGSVMINEIAKKLNNKHIFKDWLTTNQSKTDIITELALDIEQDKLHFNVDDKELYSQFSTFIYQISKSKKLTFGAKNGYKDDRIMSLAIANRAMKDANKHSSIIYSSGR